MIESKVYALFDLYYCNDIEKKIYQKKSRDVI